MDSRACTYCLDAGYIDCPYPNSVPSDLPVCEDEMTMQDLLDFDSTMVSGYNRGYAWKDLDVAPEDRHVRWPCSGRLYGKMVDITRNMLDGQQISKVEFSHRLTLIQGLR
jgi:hypothetical protein